MSRESPAITVACHLRTSLVVDSVDASVERLRALEADDRIDLLLRSWPKEVPLDASGPYIELLDRFEEFEMWADRHDASVRPPFETRSSTSIAAEGERGVLVTPSLCLAIYRENQLAGVFPHEADGETYTVAEAIDALETEELPGPGEAGAESVGTGRPSGEPATTGEVDAGSPGGDAAGGAESGAALVDADAGSTGGDAAAVVASPRSAAALTCPGCDAGLVNVQGLLTCAECTWSDAYLSEIESSGAKLVYLTLSEEPVPINALRATLDLQKSTLLSYLRTLSKRGLVEETDPDTYRACRREEVATPDGE